MNFDYELLRAGSTADNSDSGADVARKFNDNFKNVKDKFSTLEDEMKAVIHENNKSIEKVLPASAWVNQQQTIAVEGLKTSHNAIVALSQTCTARQYRVAAAAGIHASGQDAESITFCCMETVPEIDIPITIIVLN